MMEILSVAVGGALGAVCRYLLGNFISRASGSALPWGTFAINIIGCFCMGLLMTLVVERGLLPAAWRLFLCVGLLGGFTTFSSFGYESLMLLTEGLGRDKQFKCCLQHLKKAACFWDFWLREQACWLVKGYEADAVRNKQHL